MDGSTTAWAVLFTDGTLKRRGFRKFSSITYGWIQATVTHLFSLINAVISENRFAVEHPCFVTALLSAHFNSHRLVKGFVYHGFSYSHSSDHCVKVGSDFYGNHKTEQRNRLHLAIPSTIYHLVRCQNCDSSLIPYFHFFGYTDNQP